MTAQVQQKAQFYITDTLTSTKRLWVNYDPEVSCSIGEEAKLLKSQFYALDCVSCWGGSDKSDVCRDETITKSWEIPAEFMPAVEHLLMKFCWEQDAFWQKASKQ